MVAVCKFVSVTNAKELTNYYCRETEPQQDRDRDADYTLTPSQDMAPGTVPILRQDAPDYVLRRFGFDGPGTPSHEQVYNIISGKMADGSPSGRLRMPTRTRSDGLAMLNRHLMDVTLATDTSWGIALAGAETPAARAVLLSIVHQSADHAMRGFVRELGWTRRGRVMEQVQGELMYIRFVHHTSRAALDGSVAPNLHLHHVIPNIVLPPDGKVGAINMRRMHGFVKVLGASFHNELALRARASGIAIRRHPKNNGAIIDAVPDHIRLAFAKRNEDIKREALKHTDNPTPQLMRHISKRMIGRRPDGVGSRGEWREKLTQLGWTPRDVVKPFSQPETQAKPGLTLTERAHWLRQSIVQTLQGVKQQIEHAKLHQRLAPSLSRTAQIVREFVPELTRRARQLVQSMKRDYTPERAKAAGEHIQRMATGRTMVMDRVFAAGEVPKTERMVRVYARKVHAGEMKISDAAAVFVDAEQRRDRLPAESGGPHPSYRYKEGGATPENRDARMEKWTDRIGASVAKMQRGETLWPEIAKGPEQAPERRMRMVR